jgi:hypothetical protein
MAGIGLLQFARVAREVAEAALSRYCGPFSKHIHTQPTLLAALCPMRSVSSDQIVAAVF